MINRNIVWNNTASVVLSITLSALMMIDLSCLCETDVLVFNNIMQYYLKYKFLDRHFSFNKRLYVSVTAIF